jgi:hypothetical protein
MLLTYFLNDFEMVPVAPIITGITFVFTFHLCCISIVRFYIIIIIIIIIITTKFRLADFGMIFIKWTSNSNVNDIQPRCQPPPEGKILVVDMVRYNQ